MSTSCKPLPAFVVHWNRPASCKRTLAALLDQHLPLEITVLDNASTANRFDELLSWIRRLKAPVAVMRLSSNLGFAGAANVGLKHWFLNSESEWALITAHDAIPKPGCLPRLLAEAMTHQRAGVVAPEQGISDRGMLDSIRGPHFRPCARHEGWESVEFCRTALMLLRKGCVRDIGGFDERYFAYYEDVEIGLRASRAGWEVGVLWGAVAENPECSVRSAEAYYLQVRNSILVTRDYLGRSAAMVRWLALLFSTARLLVVRGHRPYNHSTFARVLALRDYAHGRFGPPPAILRRGDHS